MQQSCLIMQAIIVYDLKYPGQSYACEIRI